MSALRMPGALQGRTRVARPGRWWGWASVLSSVLVCAMVTWLHFQQRQALRQARIEVESIRQARVDLAQGFLHLSLAGSPDSPFAQDQGLALLGQALASFEGALGAGGGPDPFLSAAFHQSGDAFQARLAEWRSESGGREARAAALRIAFAELEREAAQVDAWHQRRLRALGARLDTQFALALGGAILLLGLLCAVVLFSTRAREASATALKENEDLFRLIFEMTSAGYALTSPEGTFLMVNEAFAAMLGYRPEEMVGLHLSRVTHPDDAAVSLGVLRDALSGVDSLPFEKRYLSRDGRVIWASARTTLRRNPEGKPLYFITNIQDMSERMQAEQSLRESENRLRFALEATNDGLWDVQMATRETYLSPRSCEMLGYGPEELAKGWLEWTELVHPDDLPRTEERLKAHLEGRAPVFEVEQRLRTKSGTWKWVLTRGKVVARDSQGNPLRMTGTHTDLTVQKHLEEQLLQSQKLEAIGRLAGGVAHDFNNMLTVILGYTETARLQVGGNPKFEKSLHEIQRAAERSATLTQQLLAFARQQPIAPKVLDLNETVEGMLRMLGRLIGEEIELIWRPGAGLGRVLIDPAQVDQILANLCVNARDAIAGTGRIVLETSNAMFEDSGPSGDPAERPPGACVLLSITDDGCGMDRATVEKIFEPFFTTKASGKGTGLGLATVYGIVKQNHGAIRVRSEPGMGTTFRIYLPRHAGAAEAAEVHAEEAPMGCGEVILLAEDEPIIREVSHDMLELLGYQVLEAVAPEEVIRLAEAHPGPIHLLVTDVVMPGMSGRELAERLRNVRPGMPCLFMSGYAADIIPRQEGMDDGAPFIQKPFSMRELAIKVRAAMESNRVPMEGAPPRPWA